MNLDSIYFQMVVNGDYQAAASVDFPCFHQVGPFRVYLYDNIGGFNLKCPYACDIRSKQRLFFSHRIFELFIKGF